ncbi:hypothetical protein ACFPA8_24580 [Streptomyces ovatisporus]|uniref:Transposase n=1 Tax=Streptomyces ovatisporus TaxID=1128682 RepID=A0ABV9ACU3_9ACTN
MLRATSRSAGDEVKPGLRSYVQRVTERLSDQLTALAEESGSRDGALHAQPACSPATSTVAATTCWWGSSGRSGARARSPHGLWWLCPMEGPKQTPTLAGRIVEVVDRGTDWVVPDLLFVKELHGSRQI